LRRFGSRCQRLAPFRFLVVSSSAFVALVVSGLRRFGVFSLSATCVVSVSSVVSGSRRFGLFRFQWLAPFRFRLLSAACAVSVSVVSAAFAVSVLFCFI
jgi:hypothetical protein